jgi:hypothetical protein
MDQEDQDSVIQTLGRAVAMGQRAQDPQALVLQVVGHMAEVGIWRAR